MKPLATLNRPVLATVDVATKEGTLSFKERTDVTAVPAMGVVAEAMVALVLASEALRKFGGDSLAELVRNRDGFVAALGSTPSAAGREAISGSSGRTMTALVRRDRGHIVLVGMMGAGKSVAGRRLAALLGRRFLDTDEEIAATTGRTIAEIWSAEGEEKVRAVESAILAEAVAAPSPSVIAVGGGAVLDPANRAAITAAGRVVWLRAERRHARGTPRGGRRPTAARSRPRRRARAPRAGAPTPLRGGGRRDRRRRHLRGGGDGRRRAPRDPAADRGRAAPQHPYEVVVGPGARHLLRMVIPAGARRAAVVTQAGVNVAVSAGVEEVEFAIGPGESAKTLRTIEELCRGFAARRTDPG